MKISSGSRSLPFFRIIVFCLLLLSALFSDRSEQLPFRIYRTADGLAHDNINNIIRDSRGFLWFGTADGLSRFDGASFINYGTKDGLASAYINDLLETRNGLYLIATNGGGVSRFDPEANPQSVVGTQDNAELQARGVATAEGPARALFTTYAANDDPVANRVNTLYEDRAGRIWAGTDAGLFHLVAMNDGISFERAEFGLVSEPDRLIEVWQMIEDEEGSLWIGTSQGVFRRLPDGRMIHYAIHPSEGTDYVWALLKDLEGRLWIGSRTGLMVMIPESVASLSVLNKSSDGRWKPKVGLESAGAAAAVAATAFAPVRLPNAPGEARWFTIANGLAQNDVRALAQSTDGHLWIGTHRGGLMEFDGKDFRSYAKTEGLTGRVDALCFDSDGNLWIGSGADGAARIIRRGLLSYHEADGLGSSEIISGFEDQAGELCVISDRWSINRFNGAGFTATHPLLPQSVTDSSAVNQAIIQDHTGEWWVATAAGLYRFPKVEHLEDLARTRPKAVYTKREGIADSNISRLFEDSHGDVWIGSYTPPVTLTRWERSTGLFHLYTEADGLPPFNWANVFAEDAGGTLWLGLHNGGLARWRHNRFEVFGVADGVPEGLVHSLYRDRSGRLWVAARERGAGRLDDPAADHPRFVHYSTAENLSSDNVQCFTEDQWGRIYIGTARGVDRLDPQTGRVKHFTSGDGLVRGEVSVAFSDRDGTLWFGSREGLSRLTPILEAPPPPPPILIRSLLIDGRPQPISELGQTQISGLTLAPDQNRVQIEFFGIDFSSSNVLRYQYMLEGADSSWSASSNHRTVNYANLQPGSYRFLVRAVNADGAVSQRVASIVFRILPPFWRRWWFLALATLLIASTLFAVERYRAGRMKELNAALAQSEKLTRALTGQRAELKAVNRALELEFAVNNIIAETASLAEAAPHIIEAVCESAGWDIGALWSVDAEAGLLRCVGVWHQPLVDAARFEAEAMELVFAHGEGLPGRVWQTARPLWIADLSRDANSLSLSIASREVPPSGVGLPILAGQQVLGVMEFFSLHPRELDAEVLRMMSHIGGQLGQLMERRRAEDALRHSETRFRKMVEQSPLSIQIFSPEGVLTSVNRAYEELWGISSEEIQHWNILEDGQIEASGSLPYIKAAFGGAVAIIPPARFEVKESRPNQEPGVRVLWVGAYIFPVKDERGRIREVVVMHEDVTERKLAEDAIRESEEELRRSREERLVELEHVRKRIATDLHDDIGSSLTQISILSEVVSQQVGHTDGPVMKPLGMIANASRELIDSMSDIVWAINPQKDHLSDLSQRMRRFASDTFTARNIEFKFRAPEAEADIPLGANLRREVFLIFKEGVNNMVKHSECTAADIEFRIERDHLLLTMTDNGKGYDTASESDGHGLMSMKERGKSLAAELSMVSGNGQRGTSIILKVPLGHQGAPASH